jgi:hypothetical protein
MLKGDGTVSGILAAAPGSTVAPGLPVGTLAVSGDITLNGELQLGIDRTNSQQVSRLVSSGGAINYGGSLLVTNVGPALQVNDVFQVFPAAMTDYGTNVILAATDANGKRYTWENDIASDGTVKVLSVAEAVNPNPPQVQVSLSGSTLSLAWPTNAGWTLLTNSVSLTATDQWFPYPGSATMTNVNITIDPNQSNVFFRMAYPYP